MESRIGLGGYAQHVSVPVGGAEFSVVREKHHQDSKLVRLLELAGVMDIASSAWLSPINALGTLSQPVAHVGQLDSLKVDQAILASNEIPGLFSDQSSYFPAPGISDYLVCTIGNRSVGRAALFVRPRRWHGSMQSRLTDTIERIRRLVDTVWIMFGESRGAPEIVPMLASNDDDRLQALADQCPFGMLVLDVDHAIHVANGPARAMIETASVMSLVSNRLVIHQSSDAIRFQVALRGALADAAERKMIAIAGDDGGPLLLSISRMDGPFDAAQACVIITRAGAIGDPDVQPLAEHYSLTPVEIRLVRHLVRGLSVQDAAKVLQLKVQTVRTYLKQIFQKTGTHRQVELMQLMQNGALPVL